jgi:hypothetical protein
MSEKTLEQRLLDFFGVEERNNDEFYLSPSLLSMGTTSVFFKILDWKIEQSTEPEVKKPGAYLRTLCGYAWELEYKEAHPDYTFQQPLSYNHEGYLVTGTADFTFDDGLFVNVFDTKCVATSVATKLRQGDLSLGYHKQIQWYLKMLELSKPEDYKREYFGFLEVLDRNYLNSSTVRVEPFTVEEWEKEKRTLTGLIAAIGLINNVDYVSTAIDKAVSLVLAKSNIHPYSQYATHGNIFNWRAGRVESIKPRVLERYKDAVLRPTDRKYRLPERSDIPTI